VIRLRFVTGNDPESALIRWQNGTRMPFSPSHVEALSQDGKFYIGQHMQGGMLARPVGYDDDTLMTLPNSTSPLLFTAPDGTKKSSMVIGLPCTMEQEAAFYDYVHDKIGMPYDWISILGFVLTEVHLHEVGSLICSAIMTAALRSSPPASQRSNTFSPYFPWPLTVPFHKISPAELLDTLSTHVEIPH